MEHRLPYSRRAWLRNALVGVPFLLGAGSLAGARINGQDYTDLEEVGRRFGLRHRWIRQNQTAQLYLDGFRISFEIHRREVDLHGVKVFLGFPVARSGDRLAMAATDVEATFKPILMPRLIGAPPVLRHVCIDPGHGGKDPGTQNQRLGLQEKVLVLDIAERLESLLRSAGLSTSLTRRDDRFIGLTERAAIANRNGADLFLSVHLNAVSTSSVEGSETYVLTPVGQPSTARSQLNGADRRHSPGNRFDAWNTLAGFYLQKEMLASLRSADRGLKRARFAVLERLECPGVLVEAGFLSNDGEARLFNQASHRQRLAESLAAGVALFTRSLNRLRNQR